MLFERSVPEVSPEEWDGMMALNLRTPLFLAQAALPHKRVVGRGSIVILGSSQGIAAHPQYAAYGACKAGVHGIDQSSGTRRRG